MLTPSNFTGFFKIAQDSRTTTILEDYISRYEKKYLVELFGYELYNLFIDDLSSNEPQTDRFITIFEELNFGDSESTFYPLGFRPKWNDNRVEEEPKFSLGILDMLKCFIYFEFVNEYGLEVSQTGVTENLNENSVNAGPKRVGLIESRYNQGVQSFKVIRNYMLANSSVYPEYDGTSKEYSYWGGAI